MVEKIIELCGGKTRVESELGKAGNIVESFQLSIAGYIVKPVDYKKFIEAVRALNLCWTLSKLPPDGG